MRSVNSFLLLPLLSLLVAARDAGILYEVWHTRAAQAMERVKSEGGTQLTTELVIESAGAHSLNDVYGPYNVTTKEFPSVFSSSGFTARGFSASSHALNADIWNAQPALGFYCLYRARPGQVPAAPDCSNTSGIAAAHAAMLTDAGNPPPTTRTYIFIHPLNFTQASITSRSTLRIGRWLTSAGKLTSACCVQLRFCLRNGQLFEPLVVPHRASPCGRVHRQTARRGAGF
jgi:hypothetical protein